MAELKVIHLVYDSGFEDYLDNPRESFYVVVDEPHYYAYYRVNYDYHKLLKKYLKVDFDGYYDFIWFVKSHFGRKGLYHPPVPIEEITFEEMHNVWTQNLGKRPKL
jgi:hypothetical protein